MEDANEEAQVRRVPQPSELAYVAFALHLGQSMNVQTMCGVSKKGKFICLRMSLGICTLQMIFI